MTELETIQRAKMYLDKLANGIDPLTDKTVPESDCINQVRISRCLFYVSDVLRRVIENGGVVDERKHKKEKKMPFYISHEQLKGFNFSDTSIPVSEITRRINDLIDSSAMSKLKYTSINSFLIRSGFLSEIEYNNGTVAKTPTKQGGLLGIALEERMGQNGPYRVIVYNSEAQQFILDNMEAVIEINSQKNAEKNKQADKQGLPWSKPEDETLHDLFSKHVPVSEIAITLKRTETGVRSRLKKLGLISARGEVE